MTYFVLYYVLRYEKKKKKERGEGLWHKNNPPRLINEKTVDFPKR